MLRNILSVSVSVSVSVLPRELLIGKKGLIDFA